MSSGGDSCTTTGHRYYAGLHLAFCHGLDKLLKIRAGEKTAWEGIATGNAALAINKPELFGGESREGGIVGNVDVCFGAATQTRNSYLQSVLGTAIPAFRGLFALVANRCMLSANNPYVKPWSILGQRTLIGWRDDLADIVADDGYTDMNPAHIIYETLTNLDWGGLGYPLADLDVPAFQTAANLLHAEGLGLALLWSKNTDVESFIQIILDHIDGVIFFSHVTGLLKIRLIRNDYNIGAIPVVNQSNIIDLVDYSGPSDSEVINQLTVNYVDRDNRASAITVQDIAALARMNGQVKAVALDFVGIATNTMAAKIAARELQQLAMPISSVVLVVNRKNWNLEPGDCFNFTWAPLGIADLVMRVDHVDIGLHTDSQLRITAVRDVYGLGAVSFTTPENSAWTTPLSEPADAIRRRLEEITWWQFVREYAGESEAVLAELDDSSTLVTAFCARPSSDAINYEMWARNVGAAEWAKKDTDSFPFAGTTDGALVPEISSAIVLQESSIDTNLVRVGTYAQLGDELVGITAIDTGTRTITVDRGVLDTIPVSHASGTFIWMHQGLHGLDQTPRADGESVEVRLLPSTSLGRLLLADAATETITTAGRMMRPYPPGNVQINGARWPVSIGPADQLAITWAHRDRILQTVTLNRQDEGDIGPEAGVTYTLRIYGEADLLLRTVPGLTGTSYTYLSADEQSDSAFVPARLNTSLRFELESARGTLVSYSVWDLSVVRS